MMENTFSKEYLEYTKLSGEYIQTCNQLEFDVTIFIIRHFGIGGEHILEFADYFLSKEGFSLQSKITTYNKILKKYVLEFRNNHDECLNPKTLKSMIQLRNVLAHGALLGNSNNENYSIQWITNDSYFKSKKPKKDYSIVITKSEIEKNLHILKGSVIVTRALNKIIEKNNEKQNAKDK